MVCSFFTGLQCIFKKPAGYQQAGQHEDGRETFGHSIIVDPWGRVLAEADDKPGVILAEIDPALVSDARGRIPTLEHARDFTVRTSEGKRAIA